MPTDMWNHHPNQREPLFVILQKMSTNQNAELWNQSQLIYII